MYNWMSYVREICSHQPCRMGPVVRKHGIHDRQRPRDDMMGVV